MNITDKSKEYAEGKALSAITTAIEDAYAAGYQEGYEDGYANREKPETPSKYNNVSYINLDLPSGTQWATGYLTKANGEMELLSFLDARNYNIPTIKQFQELLDNTEQFKKNLGGQLITEFVSVCNNARFWLPNGCYNYNGLFNKDNYMFWLKETFYSVTGKYAFGPTILTRDQISLYYLPVVLVSKCDTSKE